MPVKTWHPHEIVQLNVGGQKFTTTVDTLTKESDSMLGVWFSGRHDVRLDAEGRVFIDRDGFRFRHILNFLRNGSVHIPGDMVSYQEVLEEAQFFGILSLEEKLLEEIQRLEAAGQDDSDNCIPSQTSDSGGRVAGGEGSSQNQTLILTGSWLLQQHQLKLANGGSLSTGTEYGGEGGGGTVGDEVSSPVTASHHTEYRFSLDEEF